MASWLLIGFGVLGLVLCAFAMSVLVSHDRATRAQNDRLWAENKAATERLIGAWRDGYVIPDTPKEPAPRLEFGESLQRFLADFDDTGRAYFTSQALRLHAQGMSELEILRELTKGAETQVDA